MPHKTREAWLTAGATAMSKWFKDIEGANLVPAVRVSCAWAKRASAKSIGWCWHAECSEDGINELQISPEYSDPVRVLDILLHELVHASDNGASKHRGYFRRTAVALGLEGKMTATVAGDELKERLTKLADKLGPYPHAALNPGKRVGKQGTRMLKVECPSDGYTLRATRKWLDVGLPTCPCGTEMVEEAA